MAEIKKRDVQKEFNEWGEKILLSKLPRFEDLPTFELYMDQVIIFIDKYLCSFIGNNNENKFITPSMINNYVKQGIIPVPIKKKYNREHITYLLIICLMKPIISISIIHEIIEEQLIKYSINEVLDNFCNEYEETFKRIFDLTKKSIDKKNNLKNQNISIVEVAIKMAISSSISKLIADNTVIMKNKNNIIKDNNKKKKEG